ncbi:MAG: ATP-binding cassette domain-containing protein [Anaerolineaceae bacterium]|nr:ATP-binding cassette domain-containing protein [Anaerolineaceae bacterium]
MISTLPSGEALGLLGPNGAGKTTTVRLINGLFPPSQGDFRVLGLDPVTRRNRIPAQAACSMRLASAKL